MYRLFRIVGSKLCEAVPLHLIVCIAVNLIKPCKAPKQTKDKSSYNSSWNPGEIQIRTRRIPGVPNDFYSVQERRPSELLVTLCQDKCPVEGRKKMVRIEAK